MILHDAHNHLQHPRLAPYLGAALEELAKLPFGSAVVNGTNQKDWSTVADLAEMYEWIIPSFGVHPWYVPEAVDSYVAEMEAYLSRFPNAAVGEIGLDRWIEGHDVERQRAVFLTQLDLASRYDRAITIHCVRAWGAMWDVIRETPLPRPGFLLHAYSGPAEMVRGFIARGAYFSFSPYFLHERKSAQREVFRQLPLERILVETDAPDLAPPNDLNPRLIEDAEGKVVNHPANIDLTYRALAELRGMDLPELAEQVSANFERLFRSH